MIDNIQSVITRIKKNTVDLAYYELLLHEINNLKSFFEKTDDISELEDFFESLDDLQTELDEHLTLITTHLHNVFSKLKERYDE